MKTAVKMTARTAWGVGACLLLAVGASYSFSDRPEKAFVPIGFVFVLILVSVLYGIVAGILSSILSAAVFAWLLYSPLNSLAIENHTARQSISWMLLCGVAIPYLLLPGFRQRGQPASSSQETKDQK